MAKRSVVRAPHNNFFFQLLSRREKATVFFQRYLPAKILEVAAIEKMTLVESQHMRIGGFSLYNDILCINAPYTMGKQVTSSQSASTNLPPINRCHCD